MAQNQGYCTLEDVRRALRKASLPGDLSQDNQIAVDAIVSQTEELEKTYHRHWYAPTGADILSEASTVDIPTEPKSRDDEESIPTGGAMAVDADPTPKLYQGTYTGIDLARRDAKAVEQLLVRDSDGGYTDWVSSTDYSGGTWPNAVGEDYYLRVNNGGQSILYLDTENFREADDDDDYYLDSFVNAVYVTFSYGHEGIPRNVRRAVALRAGAEFAEEATIQIPENATVYNVETQAEKMRERADELLDIYR
ncbi:hypothetical protein [Halobellus rubicundus]|uniref:Uncharacterized protein n=1 Tax=Halobellus rubicundus TaxID=2996466 RepID=A0ABD5MEP5_9EURY